VGLAWNNKRVRERIRNDFLTQNLQVIQSVQVIYPVLKAASNLAVLYVMAQCYKPEKLSTTFIRYLMMIQITCDTLFWAIFYSL
jgi:hypothetical protein